MAIIRPATPTFVAEGQVCVYVTKFSEALATGVFYLIGDSLIEPDFRGYESNIVIFNGTDYVIRERIPSVKISVGGEIFEYVPASGWIQSRVYDTEDGGSGSGGGSSLTAGDVQTAMTNALASRAWIEFSDKMLIDANGIQFIRRSTWNENTGTIVESNLDLLGNPITVQAPVSLADASGAAGKTISNIQDFSMVEDGVDVQFYNLNNPSDPSDGRWIAITVESGFGGVISLASTLYTAGTPAFTSFPVYDDNGNINYNGFFTTLQNARWWIEACNFGEVIQFIPQDNNGNPTLFRVATYETAPFETARVDQQIGQLAGLSAQVASLQQGRTFSVALNGLVNVNSNAIQASSIFVGGQTNQIELSTSGLPDGSNFYIEVRRSVGEQWRTMVWKNTNTGKCAVNLNHDGVYRANANNLNSSTMQWRITNIGSTALPANLVGIEAITGLQSSMDIDSFTYSATLVTLAANSNAIFSLPSSLQLYKPKSVAFSCKRPDGTLGSNRTELRFEYTRGMDKLTGTLTNFARIVDFDYAETTTGATYVYGQISDNDGSLAPLTALQIVKPPSTTDVINNIFLEY
jgi:hypothetical protein